MKYLRHHEREPRRCVRCGHTVKRAHKDICASLDIDIDGVALAKKQKAAGRGHDPVRVWRAGEGFSFSRK